MYENNGLDPMFQEENNGMWGAASETLSRYTAKTFGWMGLGLLCTFAIAFASYATGFVWYSIIQVPYLPFILAIAEIVVVMVLSGASHTAERGRGHRPVLCLFGAERPHLRLAVHSV